MRWSHGRSGHQPEDVCAGCVIGSRPFPRQRSTLRWNRIDSHRHLVVISVELGELPSLAESLRWREVCPREKGGVSS